MKKKLLILLTMCLLLIPMTVSASPEYPLAEVYDAYGLGTMPIDQFMNYNNRSLHQISEHVPYRLDGPYLFLNTKVNIYGYTFDPAYTTWIDFGTLCGGRTTSESHIAALLAGKSYDTSYLDKGTIETDLALAEYVRNYLNSFDWKNSSETVRMKKAWSAIKDTPYVYDEADRHVFDAYGCLIEKKSVCQGYAEAFHMLCRFTGLDCVSLGEVDQSHIVNYVRADGKWYLQNNHKLGNIPKGTKHNYSLTLQELLTMHYNMIPEANKPYVSRFN